MTCSTSWRATSSSRSTAKGGSRQPGSTVRPRGHRARVPQRERPAGPPAGRGSSRSCRRASWSWVQSKLPARQLVVGPVEVAELIAELGEYRREQWRRFMNAIARTTPNNSQTRLVGRELDYIPCKVAGQASCRLDREGFVLDAESVRPGHGTRHPRLAWLGRDNDRAPLVNGERPAGSITPVPTVRE